MTKAFITFYDNGTSYTAYLYVDDDVYTNRENLNSWLISSIDNDSKLRFTFSTTYDYKQAVSDIKNRKMAKFAQKKFLNRTFNHIRILVDITVFKLNEHCTYVDILKSDIEAAYNIEREKRIKKWINYCNEIELRKANYFKSIGKQFKVVEL